MAPFPTWLLASLLLLVGSARPGIAISASDFQLTGPDGRMAARLTISGEGTPALFFFDRQGHNRLNLFLYPEGVGGLVMNDPEGRAVAILRLHGPKERPVLVFKSQGQDRMILGLGESEPPGPYVVPSLKGRGDAVGGVGGGEGGGAPSIPWIALQLGLAALAGFLGGRLGSSS